MMKPLVCGGGGFRGSEEKVELCEGNKSEKSGKCRTKLCSKGVKKSKNPCGSEEKVELCEGNKSEKSGKCRTKLCSKGVKKSKNPYATRGLDKFSLLVADLKEKRRRIYEQTKDSSDDIYVWFNFSGSDDCKPVILKVKDKQNKNEKKQSNKSQDTAETMAMIAKPCSLAQAVVHMAEVKKTQVTEAMVKVAKPCAPAKAHKTGMKKSERLSMSSYFYYADGLRQRPLLRLLAVVILILILLMIFGRSGAAIWVTVGWYMLPASTTDARSGTKLGLKQENKRCTSKNTNNDDMREKRVNQAVFL